MSSMTRAIGDFIKTATGLATFADEAANRESQYPSVEVAQTSEIVTRRFAGPVTYYRYDEEDPPRPTHAVKEQKKLTTLRVSVKAPKEQGGSSEKACVKYRDQIRDAFQNYQYGEGGDPIRDPEDDEDITMLVSWVEVGNVMGPTSDTTVEPNLHVASLEVKVRWTEKILRVMTTVIESVEIVHEVMNG